MSRQPSDKTIHGKPVTQAAFLNTIVECLEQIGSGGMQDLLPTLGPEWDTPALRQNINQTLVNMARRGTINRVEGERGMYEVTLESKRRGVSAFDRVEKDILDVIREHGGFCRLRDILEAFGVRPHGIEKQEAMNSPVYTRVNAVIRRSHVIRQDHIVRGVYNLPIEQTESLPLRGCWAAMIIEASYGAVVAGHITKPDDAVWREERDVFFSNVGGAFRALRQMRGWAIEEVVDDPHVMAALLEMKRNAGATEVPVVRAGWMDNITLKQREMQKAKKPLVEINTMIEAEAARLESAIPRLLYKRFEQGALGAHMSAPVSLYKEVATLFGVRASALSRAIVSAEPPEERLRPDQINFLTYV